MLKIVENISHPICGFERLLKLKPSALAAAIAMMALGIVATPAHAVPTVSISLDAFLVAEEDGLLFADLVGKEIPAGSPTIPAVTPEIAALMDAVAPLVDPGSPPDDTLNPNIYGLALGLHFEVSSTDPSPSTPRFWELAIDFSLAGTIVNDTAPDTVFGTADVEGLIGTTFPISGIPISDLTGPFSVEDLESIGFLVLDFLSTECTPGAVAISDFGACMFVPTSATTGDIFLGLGVEPGGALVFGVADFLGLLPVLDDAIAVEVAFGVDLSLTTVSEPGILALFGLTLVGIGIARRRRLA